MEYAIITENSKNFILSQETIQLGTLTYESSFSQEKAVIRIINEANSKIERASIWSNEFIIKKGEVPTLKIKQNWNGGIVITTLNEDSNKQYQLKSKNFWKETQVLIDENQNEILEMSSKYNWKSWGYDYFFKCSDNFTLIKSKELLLFSIMQGYGKAKMSAIFIILFMVIIAGGN